MVVPLALGGLVAQALGQVAMARGVALAAMARGVVQGVMARGVALAVTVQAQLTALVLRRPNGYAAWCIVCFADAASVHLKNFKYTFVEITKTKNPTSASPDRWRRICGRAQSTSTMPGSIDDSVLTASANLLI